MSTNHELARKLQALRNEVEGLKALIGDGAVQADQARLAELEARVPDLEAKVAEFEEERAAALEAGGTIDMVAGAPLTIDNETPGD